MQICSQGTRCSFVCWSHRVKAAIRGASWHCHRGRQQVPLGSDSRGQGCTAWGRKSRLFRHAAAARADTGQKGDTRQLYQPLYGASMVVHRDSAMQTVVTPQSGSPGGCSPGGSRTHSSKLLCPGKVLVAADANPEPQQQHQKASAVPAGGVPGLTAEHRSSALSHLIVCLLAGKQCALQC